MEDDNLFDYQYTMLDSPEPSRLVINMDAPDTSGDATGINVEPSSTCGQLPSFNTFTKNQTMSDYACWYKPPSVDEGSTSEAADVMTSDADVMLGEKQESSDRSFDIDNILGLERHCYSPRHSTPAKDVSNTFTHHVLETGSHLQPTHNVNTDTNITNNTNPLINAKIPNQTSANPSTYIRHDDKPPYTYVAMVIAAILNSDEQELALAEIREELEKMFPFFRGEYTRWKNSVRHVLSNTKCFYKVEKKGANDVTSMYVWKVNTDLVKSSTFNRQSKGTQYMYYKATLQEELGLPPFKYNLGKDLKLPPKPSFVEDSSSLAGSVSEDFNNARNDSVPTPLSTASDIDNTQYSTSDKKQSLKRKREDIQSTQQTTQVFKRQTTSYNHPYYGYQQYSQSSLPYHPSYYNYYNPSPMTMGGQWSRDFNQYGYQQYGVHPMNSSVYFNQIQAVRNMWWSYYNGMIPSSSLPMTQNTNSSRLNNASPVDLTKQD